MKGHLKCPPDTSYLCVCPVIDDFVITLSKWLWKYDPQASGSANFDNITDVVSVSFVFCSRKFTFVMFQKSVRNQIQSVQKSTSEIITSKYFCK